MKWHIEENLGDPIWLTKGLKVSDNLINCLDDNTDKLVKALNENSKSSNFLAKVWIFLWIVWTIATIIWTYYWYLSYYK